MSEETTLLKMVSYLFIFIFITHRVARAISMYIMYIVSSAYSVIVLIQAYIIIIIIIITISN